MKTRLYYLCFIVLINSCDLNAQTVQFQKTYGESSDESGQSCVQTPDSGYAIAGFADSFTGSYDGYLVKTDKYGTIQWSETFGGNSGDEFRGIAITPGNELAMAGTTGSFGNGTDVFFIKTDLAGNVLVSKKYGGTGFDGAVSIEYTSDNGFIIGGFTNSYGAGGYDIYLVKTDINGTIQWAKTYGNTGADVLGSVKETPDHGFIVAGQTDSYTPNSHLYLIKVNAGGNHVWSKLVDCSNNDVSTCVLVSADSNIVVTGLLNPPNEGCVLKFDTQGNLLWSEKISPGFWGNSILNSSTGFILAGTGNNQAALMSLDFSGGLLWAHDAGGNGDEASASVIHTNDNGYLLAGETNSYGSGAIDVYILKTANNGFSGCNEFMPAINMSSFSPAITNPPTQVSSGGTSTVPNLTVNFNTTLETTLCTTGIQYIAETNDPLILFPNPFNDQLNISLKNNELTEVSLFDIAARKLTTQSFRSFISINTVKLSKGVYFYEVRNKNGVVKKGKVVKE